MANRTFTANTSKIVSEHRADPGAAVRGLSQLLLCATSMAAPIADHTADPAWRAITAGLEELLGRLDALDSGAAAVRDEASSARRPEAA